MNDFPFSDEVLTDAALKVQDALLDALPPPSECRHQFSHEFEVKMKKLIAKVRRRQAWKQVSRRVAMVFLAALVGLGAWLTVDTEARAAFFGWIKEQYETHITYRFQGESVDTRESLMRTIDFEMNGLPDGYELSKEITTPGMVHRIYSNERGRKLEVYCIYANQDDYVPATSGKNGEMKTVEVNGCLSDVLVSNAPNEGSAIVWTSPDETLFYISAFMEMDKLVRLAESVEYISEPVYRPSWLPDGCVETMVVGSGDLCAILYEEKDQGAVFALQVGYADDSLSTSILAGEDYHEERVSINGHSGEYYSAISEEENDSLIWMDETSGLMFTIGGVYDKDTLIQIAQSVTKASVSK